MCARRRSPGLWSDSDFVKAWSGQTVSLFGSAITRLALPLTAVLFAGATPTEMGMLRFAQTAPMLLLALLAGAWLDRVRRRSAAVVADAAQAVALAAIPLAASQGLLKMEVLYATSFLVGCLAVVSELAGVAYLPTLVGRDRLLEANSALTASESAAQIAGPGLGGVLVQLLTAPLAVLADCVSFAVSAVALASIRRNEPPPEPRADRDILTDIVVGCRMVLTHPVLRPLAAAAATGNCFSTASQAVYVLFVIRELGVDPALLGAILSVGSMAGLVGSVLAGRLSRSLGIGPTMVGVAMLFGLGSLMVPLANGSSILALWPLVTAQVAVGIASPIFNISVVSLRQSITPDNLLGRVNASARFISGVGMPLGAMLGGFLGELVGLRATLVVAGLGILMAGLWIVLSPVASMRAQVAGVPGES